MADPISIPTSVPPLQVPELEQWIEQRSQELADLISVELTAIVVDSYERFIASLEVEDVITAAGDLSSFDDIPARWQTILGRRVNPHIEGTYLSGGVSAYTQAENARPIPASTAAKWADVVNQNALTYLTGRQNLLSNVGQSVYNAIRNKTQTAIRKGLSVEKLKNEIGKVAKFSEFRADMVARTETSSAYVMGTYEGQQALGEFGPIEKVWYASLDARTRETHFLMHEKYAPINQPFNVNGSPMMVPLDPAGPAEEVIQCRCVVLYLYEGDKRPDGSIAGTPMQAQQQEQNSIQQAQQDAVRTETGQWSDQDIDDIFEEATLFDPDWSGFDDTYRPVQDQFIKAIWRRQGFDKLPRLLSDAQYNQAVASGENIVVHRGLSGARRLDYVNDYKQGQVYGGKGIYGNGSYTSTRIDTAVEYAGGDTKAVMDIVIPRSARIIDMDDFTKEYYNFRDALETKTDTLRTKLENARQVLGRGKGAELEKAMREIPQLEVEYKSAFQKQMVYADRGRYASLKGYDVIKATGKGKRLDEDYYIILNRSVIGIRQ